MRLTALDDPLAAAVFAGLDRRLEPRSPAPVAVALSGGGDSLALLHFACAWARMRGRPVLALTVDHRLNPESAGWTRFARDAARAAGAGWRGLAWEGAKPATGLPAAARDARHRLIAEAARAAGCHVVLVGHTADDVAEGELMRTADAPGLGRLREWSPSPVWPEGRGVFLLRPLLHAARAELRAWLTARGLPWLDDPANDNPVFARARARTALSTAHPGDPEGGAEHQSRDERKSLGTSAVVTVDGRILLPRDALAASDPGEVRRFIAAALLSAAGTDRPPRAASLDRLLMQLHSHDPVSATLAGARIGADETEIVFSREPGERKRGGLDSLALTPGRTAVWDGRFEVEAGAEDLTMAPLAGLAARLPRPERHGIRTLPPKARAALPALIDAEGGVSLPLPFGDGPARVRALAADRLAGACGLIAQEEDIGPAKLGAAHGAQRLVILS